VNDRPTFHRPRVSRETRHLLATALLAVVALWVLGRVRYPDGSPTQNPVPALLTQLNPRPALSDLVNESEQLRARLGASLLPVELGASRVAAIRVRDDTALALDPRAEGQQPAHDDRPGAFDAASGGSADREPAEPITSDAATGLTLLRVRPAATPLAPTPWTPRAFDEPHFLMASVASQGAVAFQPVFVALLQPVASPAWPAPIWAVPGPSDLQPGSFVFTQEAQFAGLVVRYDDGVAIVPGAMLLAEANRLRQLPPRPPGFLGVDVQALTPSLAAATGSRQGVVVTRVDPAGPAAGHLMPGDVIEAADGRWLSTRAHWDVRGARLRAGDRIVLGVRRQGEWRDVQLAAARRAGDAVPLGLTLRRVANVGSEVIDVSPWSAGAAAGLERGDIITLVGVFTAPTPAQIRAAFTAAAEGPPVLLAYSRGSTSHVATLHP
jgi:hypothetical protein